MRTHPSFQIICGKCNVSALTIELQHSEFESNGYVHDVFKTQLLLAELGWSGWTFHQTDICPDCLKIGAK